MGIEMLEQALAMAKGNLEIVKARGDRYEIRTAQDRALTAENHLITARFIASH